MFNKENFTPDRKNLHRHRKYKKFFEKNICILTKKISSMTSIFVSIPSPGGKFGERGNNWGVNGGVDGIKWPRCCKSCKSKDNATTISLLLLNRRTHQARVLCDFRDIYKKGWWLRGAYSLKNGWKAPNCRWPSLPPLVSGNMLQLFLEIHDQNFHL